MSHVVKKYDVELSFPEIFRRDVVKKIVVTVANGDNALFLSMPGIGKRRIANFIANNVDVKDKVFANCNLDMYICSGIPDYFIDLVQSGVDEAVESGGKYILILDSVEHLLSNEKILEDLRSIYLEWGEWFQVISFSSAIADFTNADNFAMLSRYEIFSTNVFWIGPADRDDAILLAKSFAENYEQDLDRDTLESIIDISGAHTIYIHTLIRGLATGEICMEELMNVDILISRLITLEYSFAETLEKLGQDIMDVFGNGTFWGDMYLQKLGFFKEDGSLFSPIFAQLLDEYQIGYLADDDSGYYKVMTDQEYAVYRLFKNSSGKVIVREDIAKVLWGKMYADKYSDWSIDKVVQGVREKMESSKDSTSVYTKRGRGFWLE